MKTFFFVLGLCVLVTACNKVQQHYGLVAGQPWILGNYPTTYYVGDTMTISGLLFLGKGGVLEVGAVQPTFLSIKETAPSAGAPTADSQQIVRFLITKEMGVGKNIPVTLTANGDVVQSPAITVLQLSGVLARTDTTLWVDSITSWLPANLTDYQNQNIPLIVGSSVSSNGTVYFDNPLGVFSLAGGTVQPVLGVGSVLSDKNGTFRINKVLGSCISFDGNTLAFSAAVSDNTDTVNNYVLRLCTMDMGSKTITTLNRTLEPLATPAQIGSPGVFAGPVAQLNLVAASIHTDVSGNWYFVNYYEVPNPNTDMVQNWYPGISNNAQPGDECELDNTCKLGADGNIKSLFSIAPLQGINPKTFKAPGFPIYTTCATLISPDGGTAYIPVNYDAQNYYYIGAYDIKDQVILSAPPVTSEFKFISYDTSTITGAPSTYLSYINAISFTIIPGQGNLNQQLALANGDVLYNFGIPSLYAFNVLNQTYYCYAGTEQGCVNFTAPTVQNQTTGRAKYVNFLSNGNYTYFNGTDAKGAVYYYTAPAGSSYGSPILSGPIIFYKLYSKK